MAVNVTAIYYFRLTSFVWHVQVITELLPQMIIQSALASHLSWAFTTWHSLELLWSTGHVLRLEQCLVLHQCKGKGLGFWALWTSCMIKNISYQVKVKRLSISDHKMGKLNMTWDKLWFLYLPLSRFSCNTCPQSVPPPHPTPSHPHFLLVHPPPPPVTKHFLGSHSVRTCCCLTLLLHRKGRDTQV